MILFYDTETTGLPPRNAALEQQPRLVQLGCSLCEDSGIERASINILIQPDGFEIPYAAAKIHGIDSSIAQSCGVPLRVALSLFTNLLRTAALVVGHNREYDDNVMLGEMFRLGALDTYKSIREDSLSACTMKLAEPIIKLPPSERMLHFGYGPYKPPNLQQAHKFFLGEEFTGAHGALADVHACSRVYFKMKELGHVQ